MRFPVAIMFRFLINIGFFFCSNRKTEGCASREAYLARLPEILVLLFFAFKQQKQ